MGWVLRRTSDRINPTLAGGVYGRYITAGRGVYWRYDGSRVRFILFISDGGRYGMNTPDKISYNSVFLNPAEYKFHPGTFTKQIVPHQAVADAALNKITYPGAGSPPFANGDPIRFGVRSNDVLPNPLGTQKFWATDVGTFSGTQVHSVSSTPGYTLVDIDNNGSGQLYVWKADAGWDDPDQGLPTFCPEVEITFSGICYIEGYLPLPYTDNEEPDWALFRVEGIGRKLMDYDDAGAEVGIATDIETCCNPAVCDADVVIVELKRPTSRIDWVSWDALKQDSLSEVEQAPDLSESGTGFLVQYWNSNVAAGVAPIVEVDGDHIMDRREDTLSFYYTEDQAPAPGINNLFYMIAESLLVPRYSETYQFKVVRDNGARLVVNGSLIIDQWVNTTATNTASIALTAGVPVSIRVEYFNGGGPGQLQLFWSSPSQVEELIPKAVLYDPIDNVRKYEVNVAFSSPVEASAVHEAIMARCPGWHWTDRNGKVLYLAPDRLVDFDFNYDALKQYEATILEKTFEKRRRHRRTRANFKLYSYRNQQLAGYPENFIEENRPRLRELGGGVPNNDPPEELMVMSKYLATNIARLDMALYTDPAYDIELGSKRASGRVTKNSIVRVRNWVQGDLRVETSTCLVRSITRRGNRLDFTLLPIASQTAYPMILDELGRAILDDNGDAITDSVPREVTILGGDLT